MRFQVPLLPDPIRWLGVLAVASLLVYFSLLAPPPPSPPDEGLAALWDKQLHFAGYAALALSLAYATAANRLTRRRRALLVTAAAVLFGVAVELLQGPVPDRYFSYADVLANALGALLASVWLLVEPRIEYVPLPR